MKKLVILLMPFIFIKALATERTIPRNFDGGWYYPDVSFIQPGDTLNVTGNYAYAFLKGLRGTAAQRITIRTRTNAVFGTDGNYALILDSCAFLLIDGKNDAGAQYSLKFGKATGSYASQTLSPFTSTKIEIRYVEIRRGEVGIFTNATTGGDKDSLYIHHNYIHDLRGMGSSEAMYIGNTSKADTTSPRYTNLVIEYNTVFDVGGDGIQVCCAPGFIIRYNTVNYFGKQNLGTHATGILAGGNSWGLIMGNSVNYGSGSGLQVLGYATVTVNNNLFFHTGNNINEQPDAVYISKRGGIGSAPLTVNMRNNIITGAARYGIFNDGFQTASGLWKCNTVTETAAIPYKTSIDIIDPACPTCVCMAPRQQ